MPPPGVTLARDPADAARLRVLGSRDIRAHDPSTLALCGGEYWMFHTGRGIGSWRSRDLITWEAGPPVFHETPAWVAAAVPENRNTQFWAPDVIQVGGRYLLYYSVSTFGKKVSAIALATNATLDPASPAFKWVDAGPVIGSGADTNFNAIDPAVLHDRDGRLWLTFGSFWTGIKLVELDPATGWRKSPGAPLHALAHSPAIEAAFLHRHSAHYYLFVNHGTCCRGVSSTYHIRVGRSETITGPYLDREGRPLLEGGGTVVVESEGPFIGPGHAGIIRAGDREWFGCHFYDATQRGRPTYAIRPLTWDDQGWPVVGRME
jgi:arabinan endo-1,5-alpha-L-arabinosidase